MACGRRTGVVHMHLRLLASARARTWAATRAAGPQSPSLPQPESCDDDDDEDDEYDNEDDDRRILIDVSLAC